MKEKIKIEIEIGHWAKRLSAAPGQPVLPNSAVQNATHVWKVWVCGRNGRLESFVQRAVFRLHPSFPTPVVIVSEPPFEIEEKAFGTFPMKIELHFNDSIAAFDYEVFLMLDRDINCKSIKSFSIANPRPPEFREKLIRAGGVVVDSSDEASGPSDSQNQAPKPAKLVKAHGSSSSLLKSKSKTKASTVSYGQIDDPLFASPASSEDLAVAHVQSPQQPLAQQLPVATTSFVKTVGSRLASPSKAKLKESSGYSISGRFDHKSPTKPKPQPQSLPPVASAGPTSIIKSEPSFGIGSPVLPGPYTEPSPRVTELRAEEPKSEKLVLKISKSPIKSSPIATVKTEPAYTPISEPLQPPSIPATVAVVVPTPTTVPPSALPLSELPPTTPPIHEVSIEPQPPLVPLLTQLQLPMPFDQASSAEGMVSASEDDRHKRKKEKRKKDKDKHRNRHRDRSQGKADSDSDERRHERKRRRQEEKEKKKAKKLLPEAEGTGAVVPVRAISAIDSGVDEEVVIVTSILHPQTSQPPQAPLPQHPPPALEAEPPMLSPYLMPAVPKEDPELMSQASVESTGFRPPGTDCGSDGSSPVNSVAVSVSAATLVADAAAAAVATVEVSAYAKHPRYQWSAELGLSRTEYDQRFQLCLLAASLDDPGRLERLAAVLVDSGALTARDAEYAHFDFARLRPDCVRQLRALLMPDSASS